MSRHVLVALCALFAQGVPCARSADAQAMIDRPNVLFLFTDDQRADTLSSFGATNCRTPNMDRITTAGVSFGRAYCQGSHHGAICVPSRAMTLSGRALHHINEKIEGIETLPERLRAHGYRAFATGKWHNGRPALQRMFDEGRNVFFGGMCDHENVTVQDWNGDELSSPRKGESSSRRPCSRTRPSTSSNGSRAMHLGLPGLRSPHRTIPGNHDRPGSSARCHRLVICRRTTCRNTRSTTAG
ncbi:MAG: sulfatase-like hydrolase/transferase [Planctomycetes bacterium]|nr:sulfatase-like hydrolase/transferase [Planctomycetota bacterium]